jgi:hypothetical protein
MADTIVLWEKTLDSNYLCKCSTSEPNFGNLTVLNLSNNEIILDKMLVLKEPLDFDTWEVFCRTKIDSL